jgi:hypothetical protein
MTNKNMFEKAFHKKGRLGGIIINRFTFSPMSLYLKIISASFRETL